MLINSNSKLCNYNTCAEIQIIWCPWREQVRIYFMFHSAISETMETCSSPQLAPLPPTFAVFCFFLFSRKTGTELTVGILSFMPLSLGLGATVDAKLFLAWQRNARNLQEPAFSQWPKWPPIHLQNVNWRCHGNRTTLPGSVKIHLYLRLGRGQKGKKRQLQGENRDGGWGGRLYSALQRWRNPFGF